ncbi:pyridoxamine 5'-phosphate oxidase family protein [Luteimicrobium sp. DT211]|uniref:pyridoxamine 5'-phosphate oxidase family protein n=1 Tax=Luteimicrobium sp. DT211 TaxID=3393412 RepID=UPI003CF4DC53
MRTVHLNPEQRVFVTERHLATLTTLREDGSPHVVPVAFTWDDDAGVVRITTNRSSVKARNVARRTAHGGAPRASVCQVEGGRWLTLEGEAEVVPDLDEVVDAVARYARRYRPLEPNPDRVVLRIAVDKVMSSSYMAG